MGVMGPKAEVMGLEGGGRWAGRRDEKMREGGEG